MSDFKFELEGLDELRREMESRFDDKHNQDVLKVGADYFKGRLEETVYTHGFKRRLGKSEESMKIVIPSNKDEIEVGLSNQNTDAFYLYFHEYGTSKMRARPWMRPTWENEMQNIINKMKEEMKARLRL